MQDVRGSTLNDVLYNGHGRGGGKVLVRFDS